MDNENTKPIDISNQLHQLQDSHDHDLQPDKQNPEQVNELTVPSGETRLDDLLTQTKLIGSKKEVVRLIKQGAILIDDQKINEIFYSFTPKNGQLLRIGRKRFYKLVTP